MQGPVHKKVASSEWMQKLPSIACQWQIMRNGTLVTHNMCGNAENGLGLEKCGNGLVAIWRLGGQETVGVVLLLIILGQ
jgi:hypothetical protein